MMRCKECGCAITAETKTKRQKNGNVHLYTYYHCTKKRVPCSQPSLREDRLEKQVTEALGKIEVPEEFKVWAMEIIRQMNKKETATIEAIVSKQQKEYNECLRKISNLIDMRAALEISPEQFAEKKRKLEEEQKRLSETLSNIDDRVGNWIKKAEELFELAKLARERFKYGNTQKKKEILSSLGSNLSLKNEILFIEAKNEIIALEEVSSEAMRIYARLEPHEIRSTKGKPELLYSGNPTLLRR
jgi:oligoendopeptidase F